VQNRRLSIRRIVQYLNNDESEGGGFWLPNIQRPFVWSEEQIARLFDSIMREYPISTLLVWKTKEPIKHRKFIDNYHRDVKLTDFYVPEDQRSKLLVLDGQQRLQSLFIGLKGSYCGKELYFDVLSGGDAAPEDIRFRFAFKEKVVAVWPWVRFKDIVFVNGKLPMQIAQNVQGLAPSPLTTEQIGRLQENVARGRHEFVDTDNITFQELDGIDNCNAYKVDDIVEIFIRANSGGTKLGKSDLLFSLLAANWEDADGEMENLLEDLNKGGFSFDRDFVLKASLCVLGKGARYEISKFRDGKTKGQIIDKWEEISASIKAVRDFVVSKTYIRSDKALPSYQALIPLIYFRYRFPCQFDSATICLQEYLLRSLINGVFSGSPDNLIDKIVRKIEDSKGFVLNEVLDVIRTEQRPLDITKDVIFGQHYGSREIHLFFNLWYKDFNYTPALDENGPQVDHIFPQSLLKSVRDVNPESGRRNILRYRQEQRDQIANCMLLTADENGFKGKCDKTPEQWFSPSRFASKDAQEDYLNLHLIPNDSELWKLENFDKFIEARKELIVAKFSRMLPGDLSAEKVPDVGSVLKEDEENKARVIGPKKSNVLPEIILEIGAEGGSVTISRERIAEEGWQFRVKVDETTLYDMLSDEDRGGMAVEDFTRTEYTFKFEEALRRLDVYQWFRLYPLDVHPEFLDVVLAEVGKRGGLEEVDRWRRQLKRTARHGRGLDRLEGDQLAGSGTVPDGERALWTKDRLSENC
jgi:hypothetical protein